MTRPYSPQNAMMKDGRGPTGQALAVPATPANAVDGPPGFDPSRGVTCVIGAFAESDAFPVGDQPLWARCVKCAHCWAIAYLPMDMVTLARVTKGGVRCPRCGDGKAVMAKQEKGKLLETAQAIETGTAETTGSVGEADESAVPKGCAP